MTYFLGLLGLLFIGLKLGGVIAWSWWFVLSPLLLIPLLLILFFLLAMLFVFFTEKRIGL